MARAPTTKKRTTTTSGARPGLRDRTKVEYNLVKLSAPPPKPKAAPHTARPKKSAKAKKEAKKGPTYAVLVRRALAELDDYDFMSVIPIMHFLEANYPMKTSTVHVRNALIDGVAEGKLVRRANSYRLTKSEHEKMRARMTKKKTAKKSSAAAKKSTKSKSTKKSTDKTAKKKKTPRNATDKKKTSTKETVSKKRTKKALATDDSEDEAPAPKAKKAKPTMNVDGVIGPDTDGDISGGAAVGSEARGVWQYYDNGWFDYDLAGSAIVEGVYQEYLANPGMGLDVRAVKSGHFEYMVDFNRLSQRNISTNTERRIRRS